MTQPVAYTRYSQRVRTNANLTKDFVKIKTCSDLIVQKQDAHDKLGEPARWVLYVEDFDKSSYPDMDKAEQWMNMYSILDRSRLEKVLFEMIKESLTDFHLTSYLIDEIRLDLWTGFLSCGKTFSLHFPSIPGLSVSSISCDVFSRYIRQTVTMFPRIIRVSTTHKVRVVLGGNTTIKVALGGNTTIKVKQQVYHTMISQMNLEEREDEEGY
jgi:hypothetical protein